MEIPEWLSSGRPEAMGETGSLPALRRPLLRRRGERFLDRTLTRVISFVEEVMFNENISAKKGLLQGIEPGIKTLSLLLFIVTLSFQRSLGGVALFTGASLILALASRIPPSFFVKKLVPAVTITSLIAVPAMLNLIVDGEPLLVLHRFEKPVPLGPVVLPEEIALTRQGVLSGSTLLLRVFTSVSFVFLLTMTTKPNRLMKALSSLFPGFLGAVISVSYRYIFFLTRKVGHFIMGFRSRTLSGIEPAKGRRWIASRIGLLFSVSMELSDELAMAMQSRGYKGQEFKMQHAKCKISGRNALWALFTLLFCGVLLWKSFA